MARDFYVDTKELDELKKDMLDLGQKETQRAISAAINRTITSTASEISKQNSGIVMSRYALNKDAKKKVKKSITKNKANQSNLHGEIVSSGRPLTLYHNFKVTPKKRTKRRNPVKVTVKRGRQRTIPGAFIGQRVGTGTPQLWMRDGRSRYPLKVLKTLSIPQMISNEKSMEEINDHAEKVFNKRIKHEIEFRIDKLVKKS